MTGVGDAAAGLGDAATWVGSIGTWAVGALAATIAWRQYRNSIFKPAVRAYAESARTRVAVRIVNLGGAPGMVERVQIRNDHDGPLVPFSWDDDWQADPPVPFILPGKASAILVLRTVTKLRSQSRLEVVYGDASSSGCLRFAEVGGQLAERTVLPPGSLGLRRPPPQDPPPGTGAGTS